jgi:hypothetical protein
MSGSALNNFIKKYIKTPVVEYNIHNKICMKKYEYDLGLENPDIISSSRTTSREEDINTISSQSISLGERIDMMPNTTETSTEPDEEDKEFENRCLICGEETSCTCYEASMDEINAEEEAVYVATLTPYQKTDYEKHKKMEEFLRIYCGK